MTIERERQNNFFDICGQCKISCCQNARPPITLKRKKIIETHLEKQRIPVEDLFAQTAYIFPNEDAEGYCIFYDKETRRCRIHPVKPETCVAGPVTFDINVKSQRIEWYLKMEDICPLAGVMHKNEEALRKHLETAKKEILNLVSELDSKALKAILKIQEPETFKIGEDIVEERVLDKVADDCKVAGPHRFKSPFKFPISSIYNQRLRF